jgi:hypothetical protein
MNGINQSTVKVTLRNPLDHSDLLDYYIVPDDHQLARDWVVALKEILIKNLLLEKNFCFLGWPNSARTLEFLCDQLNNYIKTINLYNYTNIWIENGLEDYFIEEWFSPDVVRYSSKYPFDSRYTADINIPLDSNRYKGMYIKNEVMNRLHNHFEILQGTVDNLSSYYKLADNETKYAIRQLNVICHEIETLILSQRKQVSIPEWIRPSQITTFLSVKRYALTDYHRQGFVSNRYDRKFGHVYMHWTQIGKTLFEVWHDEGAPKLDSTVCDAITELEYYSGEFDVEWSRDVTRGMKWHDDEQLLFQNWLLANNLDPNDPKLSLGYLSLGHIDLERSFGTKNIEEIWRQVETRLDIYSIEVDGIKNIFNYCWTDADYKQTQIDMMRPGYDHSSRRR